MFYVQHRLKSAMIQVNGWILLMYSKLEPQNDFDKIFVHSEVDSQGRKWKILN